MTFEAQPPPQPPLQALHLAFIGFVVKAGQVNQSMQNQNAQFCRQLSRILPRVAPRRFRRNGDIAYIGVPARVVSRCRARAAGECVFAAQETRTHRWVPTCREICD